MENENTEGQHLTTMPDADLADRYVSLIKNDPDPEQLFLMDMEIRRRWLYEQGKEVEDHGHESYVEFKL